MTETTDPPRNLRTPPIWLRIGISLWLVFHFSAVVVAPASVPPTSLLLQSSWRFFQPYLQLLYLNHGYHYFAPEPDASALVAYRLEFEDGSTTEGRIPHRGITPRLLYHRHFMLTEFLAFVPAEQQEAWDRGYARHLCRRHGAERVSLTHVTHLLPTMEAVREGVTLDEPESYAEEPLGTFRCDEF